MSKDKIESKGMKKLRKEVEIVYKAMFELKFNGEVSKETLKQVRGIRKLTQHKILCAISKSINSRIGKNK